MAQTTPEQDFIKAIHDAQYAYWDTVNRGADMEVRTRYLAADDPDFLATHRAVAYSDGLALGEMQEAVESAIVRLQLENEALG